MTQNVPEPGFLEIASTGQMNGRTGAHTKTWGELDGVYRDALAYRDLLADKGAEALAYQVEEHRDVGGPGALIIGTSTLLPGRVGDEFALTRGHLHAQPDRAELYYCLRGRGVMLLETVDGASEAIGIQPGEAVHVPGHWVHRSVNVGDEPFVTLFCYPADAGQDYELISRACGMAQLVVSDGNGGWTTRPNPDHRGYRAVSG